MNVDLSNVRRKPWLIERLPWVGGGTATALYPYIYLPRSAFDNLRTQNPDPYSVALVLHEQEHIKRAKEYGVFTWYVRYLVQPSFRFEEEIVATAPQLHYIKQLGLTFDLERKAKRLSGWMYLWASKEKTALLRLQKLWAEA